MNDSYSILIIEDEKNILDFMSRTLQTVDKVQQLLGFSTFRTVFLI